LALLLVGGCRQVFGIHDPGSDEHGGDALAIDFDAATCPMASLECLGSDVLRTCTGPGAIAQDTRCGWGCFDADSVGAHCGVVQPAGGAVIPTDLQDLDTLAELALEGATIDSSSGTIVVGQTTVRSAGLGVISGIDYEVRGGVAVFRARSALLGDLALTGAYPIAIAVDGDVAITGDIDARGPCTTKLGGPGGAAGGANHNGGSGAGGGGGGNSQTVAGAGAGYGAIGGDGGAGMGNRTTGGPTYGDPLIAALVGGSGGGAGGASVLQQSPHGGGGGGGVQLVSNSRIILTGTINAGGCGGLGGDQITASGAGGGAGGTVLLEAPMISLAGSIGANGGGGGGGGPNGVDGANATTDPAGASGGNSTDGKGGAGGAGSHPAGGLGMSSGTYSGGGGGAAGRLHFESLSGQLDGFGTTSPTPVTSVAVVR
jgi:hypothetical protein